MTRPRKEAGGAEPPAADRPEAPAGRLPAEVPQNREEAEALLRQMARGFLGADLPDGRVGRAPHAPDDVSRGWSAERRYQMLIEEIPAVTFLASLDAEHTDLFVSPQIESILGFSQEEWLADPVLWFRQLHPEDRERCTEEFVRGCLSGGPFRAEFRALAADGRVVWIRGEARIVRDETGRPMHIQGVAYDITENKLAEQKFESLLESAPDAMVIVDEGGSIRFVNRQAVVLFGYEREELLGQPVEILVPERARGQHHGHREGYVRDPRLRPMGAGLDLFGRRRDGQEFPVEISLSPIRTPDGVLVSSAIRDITERKRAEQELARRAAALTRSNAELDQFAYVASHDLQEPLRMVSAFLGRLRKECGPELGEGPDEYLRFALEGAERMRRLVEDLLAYSRLRESADLETVDCNEVFEAAAANLANAIDEGDATVTRGVLPVVRATRTGLLQVFQNLLSNALKFRGSGPAVVSVEAGRSGDEWLFRVSDSGIGIDPRQSERVFRMFQRLHERDAYPGTGIGLAICKQVIEGLGGRIWIEPRPGGGTQVSFTVPAGEGVEARKEAPPPLAVREAGPPRARVFARAVAGETAPAPAAAAARPTRVLLVEDNPGDARLTSEALRDGPIGVDITHARDGEEALAILQTAAGDPLPDLVLLDLNLPRLSGREVLAAIREDARLANLPVVVLTGSNAPSDIRGVHQLRADGYVRKPTDFDDLVREMRSLKAIWSP